MFQNINAEQNRSIIALLLEMARTDAFSTPIEDRYITGIAQQLGISALEVDEIRNNPASYPFEPPATEQERMTILYFLLFTMRVDGEIETREENYLHDIGLRLGLNPALIEDLIRVMKEYPEGEIPQNMMLDQIKKYLN